MDQNEVDKLMNDVALPIEKEAAEAKDAVEDENLSWDNIEEELASSSGASGNGAATSGAAVKTEVGEVRFKELKNAERGNTAMDLDFILDIPLTMTVELGRCRLLISEMLQLGQGSVVELMKLAGEPMEIFVNQKLIARGEVVVVNEKFGVRLTDIISPAERVSRLK
jgi:flagellar motor switch protein FliN/FliY